MVLLNFHHLALMRLRVLLVLRECISVNLDGVVTVAII